MLPQMHKCHIHHFTLQSTASYDRLCSSQNSCRCQHLHYIAHITKPLRLCSVWQSVSIHQTWDGRNAKRQIAGNQMIQHSSLYCSIAIYLFAMSSAIKLAASWTVEIAGCPSSSFSWMSYSSSRLIMISTWEKWSQKRKRMSWEKMADKRRRVFSQCRESQHQGQQTLPRGSQ